MQVLASLARYTTFTFFLKTTAFIAAIRHAHLLAWVDHFNEWVYRTRELHAVSLQWLDGASCWGVRYRSQVATLERLP